MPAPTLSDDDNTLGETLAAARDAVGVEAEGDAEALAVGRSLGRYVVLDTLGTGGMGVVYAAYDGVSMLIHAMRFAESIDAARVAARISGMLFKGFNGPVQVDPFDHQLQKGVYIAHWKKVSATYPVAAEGTGFTFAPVRYFEAGQLSTPSRCRMRRP